MMTNGQTRRSTRVAAVLAAVVVAAGVVVALAVVGGQPAGAAFPGQNGKIAFTSGRDGNFEVYAMDPNGQNPTRLTNNPAPDVEPAFSPDGTKIAFWSNRDGNSEVYVMDADGQNQTNLTNNPAFDGQPAFSPDGTKIAFASDRDGNFEEVYVMDADGQNQTNLTNNTPIAKDPDWGPLQDEPPTIAVVAGTQSQSACLGSNTGRITLLLGGADQNSTLSASSSNPRLVPVSNVTFSGSAETRTATITTRQGTTGDSTVTITLTDGQMSASVPVTVRAGGNGRDTLDGTGGADLLLTQDGKDTLSALGGSDVLCGSNGKDSLSGGSEADTFDGGSGTDTSTDYNPAEGDSTTNIP